MALNNIGRLVDYIELIAGKAGINRDSINREHIYEIVNSKMQELASDTGIFETSATINTIANQSEYDLPSDRTRIDKVTLDGLQVHKLNFKDLERLQGNVS